MAQSAAETEKTFKAALEYAKNAPGKLPLTTEQQLQMYSLFKQSTEAIWLQYLVPFANGVLGPCTAPAPSRLKMVERAKWDAWNKLGKMSKQDAQNAYIALFTKLSPNWQKAPSKL